MLGFRFCVALYTASQDGQLKYTRISLASGMRFQRPVNVAFKPIATGRGHPPRKMP
jgi:hypothetical protein